MELPELEKWWNKKTVEQKVEEKPILASFNREYLERAWEELPKHVQDHLMLLL